MMVCDVYLIKLLLNNQNIVVADCPSRNPCYAIISIRIHCNHKNFVEQCNLGEILFQLKLLFAGTVNLALAPFTCSAQCFFVLLF